VSISKVNYLRRVSYFAALPDSLLSELAALSVERRYGRGQVIFLEGEPCAGLHIVGDVLLWVVARADIRRLAQAHPELAWALIESIAGRARRLVAMVEDLALRPVKARLAKLLLAEAERTAGRTQINRDQMVTQAEMAARLGTVREMIGRALRELADEGLIAFDRHRIIILDRAALADAAEGG
jgi:CRP/FNR family cyclic AMP-dependent transcriptional regulator